MQKNMELLRKLLVAIEAAGSTSLLANPVIEGYNRETVDNHVFLLMEAGLVEGETLTTLGQRVPRGAARRLTFKGHEALAAIRNESVWLKTKTKVATLGGASLPLWIEIAAAYAKELGLEH